MAEMASPTGGLAVTGRLMVPAVLGLFYTELEILVSLSKPVVLRSRTLQPKSVGGFIMLCAGGRDNGFSHLFYAETITTDENKNCTNDSD